MFWLHQVLVEVRGTFQCGPWALQLPRMGSLIEAHGLYSRSAQAVAPWPVASWASLVAQIVKNLPVSAGDPGLIPGLGRSPGERNGYSLQYSCLEESMDRGA